MLHLTSSRGIAQTSTCLGGCGPMGRGNSVGKASDNVANFVSPSAVARICGRNFQDLRWMMIRLVQSPLEARLDFSRCLTTNCSKVSASCAARPNDRSLIQIKVKDRGCGDTATIPLASDFAGVPS